MRVYASMLLALALGTPVICSDQPALAEVVGDAGLVLPLVIDAWAPALETVAARADAMRSAGRARARAFTIERSGSALVEAYDLAFRVGR